MKREAIVGGLLGAACLLGAEGLEAQDSRMNFFVMPVRSQVNGPPVRVSDNHCQTEAYAIGFGSDLRWRAYITGSAADGEGSQVARDRIGSGHNGIQLGDDASYECIQFLNRIGSVCATETLEVVPPRFDTSTEF